MTRIFVPVWSELTIKTLLRLVNFVKKCFALHRKPSKRATADDLVKKAADLAPKFEDDADEFAIALQQSPSLREGRPTPSDMD